MCCTRLAENTGRKKSPEIAILAPSHNFVGLYLLITFSCCYLFFLFLSSFFPRLISAAPQIECLPYFHTWCALSANLRCRSETCCTRRAENTRLSGYIFATKARIDNRKKVVKQQYVLHMSPQYGELRPSSG